MKQRILILFFLFYSAFSWSADIKHQKTLGVLLFPDFELLDVFGPLEMFSHLPNDINIILISEAGGPIASSQGSEIITNFSLENAPAIDLLFIPGGLGTREAVNNQKLIAWIQTRSHQAEMTFSVCTGAALLAKAGILDHQRATTNKRAFDWVKRQGEKVIWVKQARWVEANHIATSSGVAAGMDMSLALIARLYGKETAVHIAHLTEYNWNTDPSHDPFVRDEPKS